MASQTGSGWPLESHSSSINADASPAFGQTSTQACTRKKCCMPSTSSSVQSRTDQADLSTDARTCESELIGNVPFTGRSANDATCARNPSPTVVYCGDDKSTLAHSALRSFERRPSMSDSASARRSVTRDVAHNRLQAQSLRAQHHPRAPRQRPRTQIAAADSSNCFIDARSPSRSTSCTSCRSRSCSARYG